MKKLAILLTCMILPFFLPAQSITSAEVKTGGFSQAKFKKAPQRVFIRSFNIFYEVFGTAEASTTGGESFGRVHSNTSTVMGVALDGVETQDFLEITDQAYQYFVSSLESKGYQIVPADEAAKTSLFEGYLRKQGGELSEAELSGFVRATPTGFEYFVPGEKNSGKEKQTFVDRAPALSQELDDAIIADVALTFDFIDMKTFRSELLNVSNVKGKVNFKVLPTTVGNFSVGVNFSHGKTFTAATAALTNTLKKPVEIQAPVFKDDKFSETTTAQATNIPSWANLVWVTTDKSSTASHRAVCDGKLYKSETSRLLKEFIGVGLSNFYDSAGVK